MLSSIQDNRVRLKPKIAKKGKYVNELAFDFCMPLTQNQNPETTSFLKLDRNDNLWMPNFMTDLEKTYFLRNKAKLKENVQKKIERQSSGSEEEQLFCPKPNKKQKFCGVCGIHYEDYLTHVRAEGHMRRSLNSTNFNLLQNVIKKLSETNTHQIERDPKSQKAKSRSQSPHSHILIQLENPRFAQEEINYNKRRFVQLSLSRSNSENLLYKKSDEALRDDNNINENRNLNDQPSEIEAVRNSGRPLFIYKDDADENDYYVDIDHYDNTNNLKIIPGTKIQEEIPKTRDTQACEIEVKTSKGDPSDKPEKAIKKKVITARKSKGENQQNSMTVSVSNSLKQTSNAAEEQADIKQQQPQTNIVIDEPAIIKENPVDQSSYKVTLEHASDNTENKEEEKQTNSKRKKTGFTFAGMYNFLNYAESNLSSKLDVSNRLKNLPNQGSAGSNRSDLTTESTIKNPIGDTPIFGKSSLVGGNKITANPPINETLVIGNKGISYQKKGTQIDFGEKRDSNANQKENSYPEKIQEKPIEDSLLRKPSLDMLNGVKGQIVMSHLKRENAALIGGEPRTSKLSVGAGGNVQGVENAQDSVNPRKRKEPYQDLNCLNSYFETSTNELSYSLKKIRISDDRDEEKDRQKLQNNRLVSIKMEIDDAEFPNKQDVWGKLKDNFLSTLNEFKSVINGLSTNLFTNQSSTTNETSQKPHKNFRKY